MEKFVKVPYRDFIEMKEAQDRLLYLESCGVDNWEPGISYGEWLEEQGINSEDNNIILYKVIEE